MSVVSLVVAHLPIPLAQLVVCFGNTQIVLRSVRTKRNVEVFVDQKRVRTVQPVQEVGDLSGHFVLLWDEIAFLGVFNPRNMEECMRLIKLDGCCSSRDQFYDTRIAMLSVDSVFLCAGEVRILRIDGDVIVTQEILPPLQVPRCYHKVVKVGNNNVLVLGGLNTATVEMYQQRNDRTWQHLVLETSMPERLAWVYYPVIWQNKTLFVFGNDVRALCLRTREWTKIKVDFPLRNCGAALAFHKNIWVLCEWEDSQKHSLSFDPVTGTFQKSRDGDFLGTEEELSHFYFYTWFSSMKLWDE